MTVTTAAREVGIEITTGSRIKPGIETTAMRTTNATAVIANASNTSSMRHPHPPTHHLNGRARFKGAPVALSGTIVGGPGRKRPIQKRQFDVTREVPHGRQHRQHETMAPIQETPSQHVDSEKRPRAVSQRRNN